MLKFASGGAPPPPTPPRGGLRPFSTPPFLFKPNTHALQSKGADGGGALPAYL